MQKKKVGRPIGSKDKVIRKKSRRVFFRFGTSNVFSSSVVERQLRGEL